MSERKMKTVAVLITLITILVIGTISYAFFITSVDDTNKETVTAGSAKISLVFDDNDNGISATLNPGESIVKKFTLENTGTVDALCKLYWKNLYNTYLVGSLFYTLEQSTSENGTYEYVDTGTV